MAVFLNKRLSEREAFPLLSWSAVGLGTGCFPRTNDRASSSATLLAGSRSPVFPEESTRSQAHLSWMEINGTAAILRSRWCLRTFIPLFDLKNTLGRTYGYSFRYLLQIPLKKPNLSQITYHMSVRFRVT